jgi:hypothetical protein
MGRSGEVKMISEEIKNTTLPSKVPEKKKAAPFADDVKRAMIKQLLVDRMKGG